LSTSYPAALDTLTNPTSTDTLDNPSHSDQHADANDAIEAIETALGPNLENLPLGVLGYAQRVANHVGFITTEVDLTDLSVTVTVPAGRRIRVSAEARFFSSVNHDIVELDISEPLVSYVRKAQVVCHWDGATAGAGNITIATSVILTPTAASHTYKLSAKRASGTGNVTMVASADSPAFILVEDIGPV
jgi:hypothetical protein